MMDTCYNLWIERVRGSHLGYHSLFAYVCQLHTSYCTYMVFPATVTEERVNVLFSVLELSLVRQSKFLH